MGANTKGEHQLLNIQKGGRGELTNPRSTAKYHQYRRNPLILLGTSLPSTILKLSFA